MSKQRCEILGKYMLDNKSTIRKTAMEFGLSKSLVHVEVSKKLRKINKFLYLRVKSLLNKNFKEKHIRGGQATKLKYQKGNI